MSDTLSSELLRVEELRSRHFGPVSLRLHTGECLAISGPSGAGKTLLLRALADMDPNEGRVSLAGRSREDFAPPQWRASVALLSAEPAWWADEVGAHFPADCDPPYAKLGFEEDVRRWQVARLSSGERQRLALLRLLCSRPRVLLLDEPTANLDAKNTARVEALVREYMQGEQAGVCWVSHDAAQRERIADRELIIEARLAQAGAA